MIPMALADKEGWEGGHLLSMSLSSEVGSAGMDKLLAGETPWDDPRVVDALKVWGDMYDQKLLTAVPRPPSATTTRNALFYSGKAAMNPTGSWLAQEIERQAKFEVGFIPLPLEHRQGHLQRRPRLRHVHLRDQQEGRRGRAVPGLPDEPRAREVGGGEAAGHPGLPRRHDRHRRVAAVHPGPRTTPPRSRTAPGTSATTSTC